MMHRLLPAAAVGLALLILAPTVPGQPASSGRFGKDEAFEATFDEAGAFAYHCHPHPQMTGVVVVSEEGDARSGEVDVDVRNHAYAPHYVKVKPGTLVRWTNRDPENHTVTFGAAGGHDHGDHAHAVPAGGPLLTMAFLAGAALLARARRGGP